ncbi:MAG: SDR family NAD(P)-dependent oxidoreductase [Actinomycetota bacterium]
MATREGAPSVIEGVMGRFHAVDVLVGNAGNIQMGPIDVQTEVDCAEAMDVMFSGVLLPTVAVPPTCVGAGPGTSRTTPRSVAGLLLLRDLSNLYLAVTECELVWKQVVQAAQVLQDPDCSGHRRDVKSRSRPNCNGSRPGSRRPPPRRSRSGSPKANQFRSAYPAAP